MRTAALDQGRNSDLALRRQQTIAGSLQSAAALALQFHGGHGDALLGPVNEDHLLSTGDLALGPEGRALLIPLESPSEFRLTPLGIDFPGQGHRPASEPFLPALSPSL